MTSDYEEVLSAIVPYRSMPVEAAPELAPGHPWRQVSVSLELVPDIIQSGETLRFVVAISNIGADSLDMETCPGYFMTFGESSISTEPVRSLLNCEDASAIRVHGVERFAMEIEVPAEFELEDNGTVHWRLEPGVADANSLPIEVEE